MAQKAVLNVQAMNNEETKQKAMKAAAGVCGVESIEAIVKDQKLTVIGLMNILAMVKKLETKVRKVEIILVGPAKEEKDAGSKKDGNEKKSDRRLTMQKAVLKVEAMNNEKTKQKAMKAAAGVCEVELIAANVKDQKLTVIGLMNILAVVKKLEKKVGKVEIILVGPAKEEKKDAGSKKDGNGKQLTMQLKPVLKVQATNDEKTKQKAVKAAPGVCGVELKAAHVKVRKLTLVEQMDIGAVAKKPEEVGKVAIKPVVPAKEEKKDAGSKKDGGGGGEKSDKTSKKK